MAETSPGSSPGGSLLCFHVSHFPSWEEEWALVWLGLDFWAVALWRPGNTHASGHGLPLSRALEESLVCCPQAGFPTFPTGGVPLSGTRGKRICWIQIGGQKRRVQVPLDGSNATGALVPALPQPFRDKLAAAMAELGEFGPVCGNFEQGAARTCNG